MNVQMPCTVRHLSFVLLAGVLTFAASCSNPRRARQPGAASALDAASLAHDIALQTQARIDQGYHLGTVIGVLDERGARYYGFGQLSLTDSTKPDADTLFELGSVTKTFTSTLLADLHLRGELDMRGPIERYLPVTGPVVADSKRTFTLEALSTHTAGLPRNPHNLDPNDDHRFRDYSREDLDAFLSEFTFESPPGEYSYSNVGFMVLEHAIETHMNTSYESLIQDRIARPLKMADTHFHVPDGKRARLATPYRNGQHTDEIDVGQFPAMGGLRSTARDMLTYLGAHLGLRSSPVSEAMRATHQERLDRGDTATALGWEILKRSESGKTIHYYKGGTNGFVSFAGFDLDNRIGVVVLCNGTRWFSDLGFRLLDPAYPLATPQ